ncbi:Leucine-rich repeat-containing protein 16C [Chelonia mydas]|uniref:Leucine-rich repeat-containing protein 16C n=1 Tax=Chelonia mydas TaxID=8469 RepID=M7ATX2_CHEMY|nr:Leucine-rich repeat-containing protein 16C [Chelonia mydas]
MSLKKVFPDSSPGKLLKNYPPSLFERIRRITDSLEEMLQNNQGPCGGFSETYAALCDYNGFTFREEIQWDVDNIYHSQDCREFNLLDFAHLESRDVALSITALSFNLWFTKLYCKDFRLNLEISEQLLYMLSKSVKLEELVLENSGLKCEFAQRMAQALRGNPDSALSAISLAGNQLEDRGASTLCQSLASNGIFSASLQHLDLSGNPGILTTDDASSLHSFLSHANSVSHLNLAGTDCALDALFGALALGCCANLAHLDLSKNVYSHKKLRDVPPAIKLFFSKAAALRYVGLACTKLPPEAVSPFSPADNRASERARDKGTELYLCQGAAGARSVTPDGSGDRDSLESSRAIAGFDADMVTLVLAIGRSKSIRHVSLGKNFNIKSKDNLADVLHRIVQLTQEDDCPLQSLSVAESRLKLGTNVLLNALGSNPSLSTLDISGNTIGDTGAKMLAKALQINTQLRTVIWDRNNTTAHGFLDVARALERNYTLRSMPLPMSDMTQAYRSNPEKTEEAVHKIQSFLARNQMRRTLPKQTFRLQQGIVTSSSEQNSLACTSPPCPNPYPSLLAQGFLPGPSADSGSGLPATCDACLGVSSEIRLSVIAAVADGLIHEVLENLTSIQCRLAEDLPKQPPDLHVLQADNIEEDYFQLKSRNLLDVAEKSFAAEEYKMALRRKNKHFRSIRPMPAMRSKADAEIPAPRGISPGSARLVPSGTRTFKKKIGNFFAFKKPKSSRGWKCEKEPEGSPSAAKGRKSTRSDISKPPSKAGEPGKALSKSEEGGLAVEPRANAEPSQTPDAAHRIRPKYSREGKSQSLILLSGEDEEVLGAKHEKRQPFEKSDGEIPNSFEQRVHVMLHRIGVTKVLSSEGKKKQVRGDAHTPTLVLLSHLPPLLVLPHGGWLLRFVFLAYRGRVGIAWNNQQEGAARNPVPIAPALLLPPLPIYMRGMGPQ